MKKTFFILMTFCAFLVVAEESRTNSCVEAFCREVDQSVAERSWHWRHSAILEASDVAFQDEIRSALAVKFPHEYAEALSCAGNTHNPKMSGLMRVFPKAVRQTETWRRIADYSVRQGYAFLYDVGVEKLTFMKDADGQRPIFAFVYAGGRVADVALALQTEVGKFRKREKVEEYDDAYAEGAGPSFHVHAYDENGKRTLRCGYHAWPEPECAWRGKTRQLGHSRTYAEFATQPAWQLLARRPVEYSFEDILKVLGKPTRSGKTDMRWTYEISDADDCGKPIRHTLMFSFAPNGKCTGWVWLAE